MQDHHIAALFPTARAAAAAKSELDALFREHTQEERGCTNTDSGSPQSERRSTSRQQTPCPKGETLCSKLGRLQPKFSPLSPMFGRLCLLAEPLRQVPARIGLKL